MKTDAAGIIESFVDNLRQLNPRMPIAIVLIGSAARDMQTEKSDIDILLISDSKPILPSMRPNIHVHHQSKQEFLARLRERDDLAAWCVRYGIEIQDNGDWARITSSAESKSWPDWKKKIVHATRRLTLCEMLLGTGDVDAAAEEALHAASHVARAILLQANTFPLSRPELIEQMHRIGQDRLSEIIRTLLYHECDSSFVGQVMLYLKKLLCALDSAEYGRIAKRFASLAPLSRTLNNASHSRGAAK